MGRGALDTCINITSEKGNIFTCSNKAALEEQIKTQMTDNQCWRGNVAYLGMTELCICDTDGCNYEARNHELPHDSTGNPVNSANTFIFMLLRDFISFRNIVDNQANYIDFFTRMLRSIDINLNWGYTCLQFSSAWHLQGGWCFKRKNSLQKPKGQRFISSCRYLEHVILLVGMYTYLDEKRKIFVAFSW